MIFRKLFSTNIVFYKFISNEIIQIERNSNLLLIPRCLILRHFTNNDKMNKPIKNTRNKSRDSSKLPRNKNCSNIVVDLTESEISDQFFDEYKVLNIPGCSEKQLKFSKTVIEISSESEAELHTSKRKKKLKNKLKIKKSNSELKIKTKKDINATKTKELKDSTLEIENIVAKLSEKLKDRMDNNNLFNLQRTYSDSALQKDWCLNSKMYWLPYSSYLPKCNMPVRNIAEEIGTKKKYPSKPPRALSTGDVANATSNYIDDVNQEAERLKNFRQWQDTAYGKTFNKLGHRNSTGLLFTLMSYNVLAQILLTQHAYLYRQHDPRALFWEHRKWALMREFEEHNADILCLQEVEKTHLDSFYSKLNDLGYKGIFKSRTGIRIDGCALYYKEDKFNLVEYITVEYFQPDIEILNRENIAIIARFSDKSNPSNEFVVATTHLLYNPKRQDVRLAQTEVLLAEIDRIAFIKMNKMNEPEYLPIIITGDFNLEPYTAVYNLLANGELEYSKLTRRQLNVPKCSRNEPLMGRELLPKRLRITDHCQHADIALRRSQRSEKMNRTTEMNLIRIEHSEKIKSSINDVKHDNLTESIRLFSTGKLTHGFNLQSVYEHLDGKATTNQDKWITVDYIFYSTQLKQRRNKQDENLKLLSKYEIPTVQQCKELPSIPNLVYGSDHLALVAKFYLENK